MGQHREIRALLAERHDLAERDPRRKFDPASRGDLNAIWRQRRIVRQRNQRRRVDQSARCARIQGESQHGRTARPGQFRRHDDQTRYSQNLCSSGEEKGGVSCW